MLFSTSLQKAIAGDQSLMTFPIGRPFILISEPGKKMAFGSKFMMPFTMVYDRPSVIALG